jgi:predicted RNA-binding Zn ribbon-like protein
MDQITRQPHPSDAAPLELVNSLTAEGSDRLDDSAWLSDALARWELDPGRPLLRHEVESLRRLRVLLKRLTRDAAARGELGSADLELLNDVLGRNLFRARLEPRHGGGYYVEMTPEAATWIELAVGEIAGSFGALLRRSHPPRIKVCANETCGRAFYDESRSRTRRWCSGAGCGNLVRVRRHRRAAAGT